MNLLCVLVSVTLVVELELAELLKCRFLPIILIGNFINTSFSLILPFAVNIAQKLSFAIKFGRLFPTYQTSRTKFN